MRRLEALGTWVFALVWATPLLWMIWAAFHDGLATFRGEFMASWTLQNFVSAFSVAPFGRYYVNTIILVLFTLCCQAVVATLAAYVFARTAFRGSHLLFYLVLAQLTIAPEVLMVENYRTLNRLHLIDTVVGIGLPYIGSAFAIFLLRQGVVDELDFWGGNVFLVIFALVEVLLFGWVFGMDKAWAEIHHGSSLTVPRAYKFIIKYVTPAFLLVILTAWLWQDWRGVILLEHLNTRAAKAYALGTRAGLLAILAVLAVLVKLAWRRKARPTAPEATP